MLPTSITPALWAMAYKDSLVIEPYPFERGTRTQVPTPGTSFKGPKWPRRGRELRDRSRTIKNDSSQNAGGCVPSWPRHHAFECLCFIVLTRVKCGCGCSVRLVRRAKFRRQTPQEGGMEARAECEPPNHRLFQCDISVRQCDISV